MHRPAGSAARGIGRRFALLAAVTLTLTVGTLAAPGLAAAQLSTPTPAPTPTATLTAQPALVTPSPTGTTDPATTAPTTTAPIASADPGATSAAPAASSSSAVPTATPTATVGPDPALATPTTATAPTTPPVVAPAARVSIMAGSYVSPHGPYGTMNTDSCAVCHRAHTSQSNALLKTAKPQSNLCFTCHDGTGASTNVAADFSTANTTNVASTTTLPGGGTSTTGTLSNYFRHDATVATSHTLGVDNEFGGVLNRHTECSDCHDPHQSQPTNAVVPAANTAWPISGRLSGVSGVAVTNGGTAQAPTQTYTVLDGTTSTVTYEYQLCLKCHSGFTTQKSNTGVSKMAWALDAGLEFNPVNNSFHPVEAQGKNQSVAMAASLNNISASTTAWKVTSWVFTNGTTTPGTVRCTQCHSASMDFATSTPQTSKLNTHVSANRSMLLQPYRDRQLHASNDAWNSADYALCFMCHTDTPFKVEGGTPTNFSRHGLHTANIRGKSSGSAASSSSNIDLPDAGSGNALCSECHYRTHSTATDAKFDHLISFSPNVLPNGSQPMWQPSGASGGTCWLICHGQRHDGWSY